MQSRSSFESHGDRSRLITALETTSLLRRWLLDPLGRLAARFAEVISRVIVGQERRRPSRDYGASDEDEGATEGLVADDTNERASIVKAAGGEEALPARAKAIGRTRELIKQCRLSGTRPAQRA